MQAGIGKASFSEEELVENVKALHRCGRQGEALRLKGHLYSARRRPSTMGPGVKVEPGSGSAEGLADTTMRNRRANCLINSALCVIGSTPMPEKVLIYSRFPKALMRRDRRTF